MMSFVYLPDDLKRRLIRAARRHGFAIDRGRRSQLAEYIAYLVEMDEQAGRSGKPRSTLPQALGLLARSGGRPPTDAEIEQLLDERRRGQ